MEHSVSISRDFTPEEYERIVLSSVRAGRDLLPYLCRENLCCISEIQRHIGTVEKFHLTPEDYWSGSEDDYTQLIALLAGDHPGKPFLLMTARQRRPGGVSRHARAYWQRGEVMFEFVRRHAGYVALRPSAYMALLYPDLTGKLFVYPSEAWNNRDLSGCDREPFLVLDEADADKLPELISKAITPWA